MDSDKEMRLRELVNDGYKFHKESFRNPNISHAVRSLSKGALTELMFVAEILNMPEASAIRNLLYETREV